MTILGKIFRALKKVRTKLANKLVQHYIPKSRWAHLVDASERKDDLGHQKRFDKMRRRGVDEFGLTWKQSTELFEKSLKLPEEERFSDVDAIIKDEGDY